MRGVTSSDDHYYPPSSSARLRLDIFPPLYIDWLSQQLENMLYDGISGKGWPIRQPLFLCLLCRISDGAAAFHGDFGKLFLRRHDFA